MSTFDHRWYWTLRSGCRQGTEMREAAILAVALWLTLEESAWQRLWRGRVITTNFEHNQVGETRGNKRSRIQLPRAFNGIFACSPEESLGYGGWPLIKLILLICSLENPAPSTPGGGGAGLFDKKNFDPPRLLFHTYNINYFVLKNI